MEILVPIVLFGSIPLFLILFKLLPARQAVIVSFIGAWLFLPIKTYEFEGLPDYDKLFAVCSGVVLAVILFDRKRLLSFRPHWVDIPMLVWCLVPIASSVSNGLGVYDGLSESFGQTITWGVPYFIGRVYFTSWQSLRDLTIGFLVGGLIYIPLLIFEMRLSPQLHRIVYGYHQHAFHQTIRFGGYRPMVFMDHGLMVAFWMMAVTLIAIWLWRSGTLTHLGPVPFVFIMITLIGITILMRSFNAWAWLTAGAMTLFLSHRYRTSIVVIVLMVAIALYTVAQAFGVWPGEETVTFMTGLIGPDRAQSLEFRYFNEDFLTEKARQRWLFGWAGWDRQHIFFAWSNARTIADAMWIIVFGKFGAVGLFSLVASMLLPSILLLRRYPPWLWAHPTVAPAAVLAVILILYMLDGLLNSMINPVFALGAGGLLGTYVAIAANDGSLEPAVVPEVVAAI